MKIGNLTLDNNVFIAPMAGITDLPFRIICKEQGCGLVYTEMISSKGMYHNDEKTHNLMKISEGEKPTAVQIFGSDPDIMSSAMEKLNTNKDAAIVDINMGCPAPKIVKNSDGSALMRNPELVGRIVKAVVDVAQKPVTVKIRKGWDDHNINAVEIAKIIEDNGAKAITVHGRTREQFYSGKADWDIIKKVKEAVRIPVIGNGDIFKPQDALDMLQYTNCDGVMIGRGIQGNPWLINGVVTYLKRGEIAVEPSAQDKINMIMRHLDMAIAEKGEFVATKEMRKHIAWYIKGMKNSTYVKERIFKINSRDEIVNVLKQYLDSIS